MTSSTRDGYQLHHREVSICFYLHTAESFRKMVEKIGYRIKAIFGDYEDGTFKAEESPFMIWVLTL